MRNLKKSVSERTERSAQQGGDIIMKEWTYNELMQLASDFSRFGEDFATMEDLLDFCDPNVPDVVAVKIIRAVLTNRYTPEAMTEEQKKIMNTFNRRREIKLTHSR